MNYNLKEDFNANICKYVLNNFRNVLVEYFNEIASTDSLKIFRKCQYIVRLAIHFLFIENMIA